MRLPFSRSFGGAVRPPWPFGINTVCPQAKGLVAWWPCLETGAVVRDLSLGTAHLTRAGTSWVAVPGVQVMAPDFNGTSSDVFTRDDSPISGMPFTVSVWAIGDDYSATQRALFSLSHASLADRYQVIIDNVASGCISAQIVAGASSAAATTVAFAVAGELLHAVAVYESSTSRAIYLNAKDKVTSAVAVSPAACSQLTVGARRNAGTAASFFDGRIVEARVYNRALTDQEVWDLYAPQTRWALYQPWRSAIPWFDPIAPTFALPWVPRYTNVQGDYGAHNLNTGFIPPNLVS